ncbi:hypothetical protein So717_31540 [Roseobacter cerasinus]|uniref:Outer membrane protein beta-barrel domain-containing protein n=1 Tax=Roseobacter cerasinus TaxID=2602289 RepID=A0A640VWE6_9RHOB|nr:hypothetical protein [Roseobacter cerasinus]GFE51401.1 hypothetical protein So717_31540 [Roseobacter cerasinus]
MMMRHLALALTLLLASAHIAGAGPWLREKGTGFVATSGSITAENDVSGTLYAEYGLRDRLTLGADIFYGIDRTLQQSGSGILFLRFPLSQPDATHKWAWHAGLGARSRNMVITPAVEAGLSWGRGIQIGDRFGWAVIDSSVNIPGSDLETRIKLDGTIGLGFTDHVKGMAQLFTTHQGGDVFVKVAPSLLVIPGKGQTTLQLSAEIPVAGGGETQFKLGIWRTF